MEYPEFVRRVQEAANLAETGRSNEAVNAYYQLILSDVSDIDKAALSVSLAILHDKLGKTEEALSWFDKGIEAERTYCRYEVTEKKADYLSQLGQNTGAAALYEDLVVQPYVSEAEKERMRSIIKRLLTKSLGAWK